MLGPVRNRIRIYQIEQMKIIDHCADYIAKLKCLPSHWMI